MTIFERLLFLETDLDMIIGDLRQDVPGFYGPETRLINERLKDRFVSLALVSQDDNTISYLGSKRFMPKLNKNEQNHLNKGNALIKVDPGSDGFASVYVIKGIDPANKKRGILYGETDPDYLWGSASALAPLMDIFIIDEVDNILFSSLNEYPSLNELKSEIGLSNSTGTFEWSYRDEEYLGSYWTFFIKPRYNTKWMLIHSQAKSEILKPLDDFKKIFLLVVVLTFLIVLSLSINQIRKNLVPIELLQKATHKVAEKDYGSHVQIDSKDEFEELGNSFNEMVDNIDNHMKVMKTINKIGLELSAERDTHRLLQSILNGARSMTNADGYALFSITEDNQLLLSIMMIDSLDIVLGSSGEASIPLYDKEGNPNINNVAAHSVLEDKTVNIPDIYSEKGFDFSYNYAFDREKGYKSRSFLSVPLKDHENEITGVLQLINARDRKSGEIGQFSDEDRRLTETLASQAGVALSKNKLVKDLTNLFDALVELISTAIDEKSPYTGGHSRRVSDLTIFLAEAVSHKRDGIYNDISFTEEDLYELKISSLLHDCGKITTPVHVMDKSSKLQTIFDRINLIDTRFEILKRDKQISLLREKLSATNDPDDLKLPEIEEEIRRSIEQLDKDRDLIRNWNSGSKFMAENIKRTLEDIAEKYIWIDENGKEKSILSDDEVYNLTITEGTITPKEREVLNNHIIMTIKMLESLSYPKLLKNVPRYVATHHERSDGSGYPKGIRGDQIPLQGKILAIADVFEALIAKDRPYKKGKTIAEALHILGNMKEEGKIDPDLFNVFISEEVYLRYAEKHLPPEQLGDIDLSEIPGYNPSN
jgi:HD-GYP domain-containing protein (c-di-GMP phosphodiesterase class II)